MNTPRRPSRRTGGGHCSEPFASIPGKIYVTDDSRQRGVGHGLAERHQDAVDGTEHGFGGAGARGPERPGIRPDRRVGQRWEEIERKRSETRRSRSTPSGEIAQATSRSDRNSRTAVANLRAFLRPACSSSVIRFAEAPRIHCCTGRYLSTSKTSSRFAIFRKKSRKP